MTFFVVGTEPQDPNFASTSFAYALTRKYLLCVFLYLLSFHYGRPAVRVALAAAKELRASMPGSSDALHRVVYGTTAALALWFLCLYQALYWGANEDIWVMEASPIKQEAYITRLGFLVIVLVAEVCLMAALVSALPNVLAHVGSTTLGSYVAHGYVNLVVTVVLLNKVQLSEGTYLATVFGVPVLIQLVVGPVVQAGLLMHLHVVVRAATRAVVWATGHRLDSSNMSGDDEEGKKPVNRERRISALV